MGADDLDGLLAFARGPAVDRLLRLMNRFHTGAEQLSNDHYAVRASGVYSLAGLADDWIPHHELANILKGAEACHWPTGHAIADPTPRRRNSDTAANSPRQIAASRYVGCMAAVATSPIVAVTMRNESKP